MDNKTKNDIISNLVSIGYYWIGDENPQCSLNICKLLQKLNKVSTIQGKKIDDLYSDWKSLFSLKYNEKTFSIVDIPNNYSTNDDTKLLWISTQAIMNLIAATNFEMAYMFLLEMSENWYELYINVISTIKKSEYKLAFSEWLTMHFLVALDINGSKEMEIAGYKITKIDDN